MTEELEKEAIAKYKTGSYPQLHPDHFAFIHGYLDGAEPREKRIVELEAQIEKMRNCANCKNYNGNEGFCVLGSGYGYNCNLEKWEIKEK